MGKLISLTVAGLVLSAVAAAQQPAWTLIGWRTVVLSSSFRQSTIVDAIDKTAAAGAKMMEGYVVQKVSAGIPKSFDWNLADAEVAVVRQKLRSAGVSMPAYYTRNIPKDEEGIRKLFGFAKALGVETIIGEPPPEQLAFIDKFATEYGINVAIHNHTPKNSPFYWDPKNQMQALEGRSKRMGVCPDIGAWVRGNIKPAEALAVVKDRLLGFHVHDPNQFGPEGRDVALGTGVAGVAELLTQVYHLGAHPMLLTLEYSSTSADASAEIKQSVAFLDRTVTALVGERMDEVSRTAPVKMQVTPEERQKIEAAIPRQAAAKPKQPRKVLVFGLNAAYGGHRSIPYANVALELMGKQTGAFEPVFSNDLANLRFEKLRQFDAIYLNNTVGPIFNAQEVRDSLSRYVREGGGLAGHHGTGRASLDWPEIGAILGAVAGPHAIGNEKITVKVDDPKSPINAAFGGKGFEITDEFFRPAGPYSRENLHVLLSFDVPKTDMTQSSACAACPRADNDYAISWIHKYGKGRVFYSALGHTPGDFWNPQILKHFLAGIQFVLGDLEADTTPSAKLAAGK